MYKVLKQQLENTHLDMAVISFFIEKLLFYFVLDEALKLSKVSCDFQCPYISPVTETERVRK